MSDTKEIAAPTSIDTDFRTQLKRYQGGEISGDEFKTVRLSLGLYSQRQAGRFMIRTKLPSGAIPPGAFHKLADFVERYSGHPAHITTRQDIQLYDVTEEDLADALDLLADAGITTRGAGGNTIRNITVCDLAALCKEEVFNVRPVAQAVSGWFIEKSISRGLPRKFKITFSGCDLDCGGGFTEDIGAIARLNEKGEKGFKVLIGGGQGGAPKLARTLEDFVPFDKIHITIFAVLNVFNRHGARINRNRARIKFMIDRLGFDRIRDLYKEEREALDDMSSKGFSDLDLTPISDGGSLLVKVPVGDLDSVRLRAIADLLDETDGVAARTTKTGDLLFTGIRKEDETNLSEKLNDIGLRSIAPAFRSCVYSCSGSTTCNEGITNSKGLARRLEPLIENNKINGSHLTIGVDGCPNSCARHHTADIGLQGSAKKVDGRFVPHYQIYIGGISKGPNPALAVPVVKVPAKRAVEALERVVSLVKENHNEGENVHDVVKRLGSDWFGRELYKYTTLPSFNNSRDAYLDWDSDTEFNLEDVGPGECAGAALEIIDGLFESARRDLITAQNLIEQGDAESAVKSAHVSAVQSAKALLVTYGLEPITDEETFRDFNNKVITRGFVAETWRAILVSVEDKLASLAYDIEFLIERHEGFMEECLAAYTRINAQTNVEEKEERAHEATMQKLDLTGVKCPFNYIKVKLALEEADSKTRMEVILDDGQPVKNVPQSLRNDGHTIVSMVELPNHQRLMVVEKA
ncbi:Ferredoxin--sulfite reductase [hydrothermal vent metagenome]|uniref:Ferredoxin--sulfite reductase n=1 Tax=hydrothermal vent metagenome TaxID=652676 RepID=A0A3B1D046_9ZZZZ